MLQLSQMATLEEANNINVKTLRGCIKHFSERGLAGSGSQTWGQTGESQSESKSLLQLIWGLLSGAVISLDVGRKPIDKVFDEDLIVPHKRGESDWVRLWVIGSFIPFYDCLWTKYLNLLNWLYDLLPLHNFLLFGYRLHPVKPIVDEESPERRSSPSMNNGPPTPIIPNNLFSETSVQSSLANYSSEWTILLTSIIAIFLACLSPVAAITILAMVKSKGVVLGLVAVFTAVYALGLLLFTPSSSRGEGFGATIA
jgi:hypothetical protein